MSTTNPPHPQQRFYTLTNDNIPMYAKSFFFVKNVILGVLVTGGVSNNDATQRRVELIDFDKGGVWTCPELPFNFFAHTQDTLPDNKVLLCGGFDTTSTRNFCYQMEKGTFPSQPKHQFRTPWWDHISWTNKTGFTFVLGGERTSNLTVFLDPEVFKADKVPYDPPYPSRYV